MNFNIFWGFQKNEYFGWYEGFVDKFGGSSQNWTIRIYGSFICLLGYFLKVNVQNGGYFWGLLKFQILLGGRLKFLIFFG